jgi:hypothetical protein
MRIATAILAVFLAAVPTVFAAADLQAGGGLGGVTTRLLPAGLDGYYPPVAAQPVYLFKMLSLETSFSGIVVDLMEDDIEGARGSFEDFQRQYREVAGMVPEWKGGYPEGKVKELGAALAVGDKAQAMSAFGAVGKVCHGCHVETMVPVQQKYRWGNMGTMTIKDPLSGVATGYTQFKKYMAANLAGITVDLRQGQTDNARKQFQGFKARFQALSDSCGGCHENKSRYYVDSDVQDTLDEIGEAFRSRTVAADAVTALAQKIGRESCSKCHLVHVPAALAGTSRR